MRNVDENMVRWASQSKPALGGISFFINFLFSITLFLMFNPQRELIGNIEVLGLIIACSTGFLAGLADDAYNTRPLLKFLAQLSCALILIFTGTSIHIFETEWINFLLTIAWVVGIMNSINMLDNMDAISTATSICIILSSLIVLSLMKDFHTIQYFILIGVLGALLGFLYYNWNPSKMYMGDTGSQFLGVLLAAIGIYCFWNAPFQAPASSAYKNFLLTVIIFLVPLVDTTTVTINRMLKGKSPFVGGKDHTTHHLSYAGFSDRQVAIILSAISFLSCLITLYFLSVKNWKTFHTVFFTAYILFFFALLFISTHVNRPVIKNRKDS